MAKAVSKTRAHWAAEIRAAHTKSVAAILKLGLTLTAAKQALPHGEWLAMVKTDLPFTATVAQRLMKIAADPKLANAARAQLLPPAWSALYELTKLPEETFAKALGGDKFDWFTSFDKHPQTLVFFGLPRGTRLSDIRSS